MRRVREWGRGDLYGPLASISRRLRGPAGYYGQTVVGPSWLTWPHKVVPATVRFLCRLLPLEDTGQKKGGFGLHQSRSNAVAAGPVLPIHAPESHVPAVIQRRPLYQLSRPSRAAPVP